MTLPDKFSKRKHLEVEVQNLIGLLEKANYSNKKKIKALLRIRTLVEQTSKLYPDFRKDLSNIVDIHAENVRTFISSLTGSVGSDYQDRLFALLIKDPKSTEKAIIESYVISPEKETRLNVDTLVAEYLRWKELQSQRRWGRKKKQDEIELNISEKDFSFIKFEKELTKFHLEISNLSGHLPLSFEELCAHLDIFNKPEQVAVIINLIHLSSRNLIFIEPDSHGNAIINLP